MEARAIFLPGGVMGSSIAEELISNEKLSGNLHFHEHFNGQLKSYSLYGTLYYLDISFCVKAWVWIKTMFTGSGTIKIVSILKTSHQR